VGHALLFVVAGSGIWHSVGVRTPHEFVCERLRRLLVPLLLGSVLLVPPQIYFAMRAKAQDPGSYWQFLGWYFDDVRLDRTVLWSIHGSDPDPAFEMAHLWFLHDLLLYSILLIPVFAYLRRPSGRRLVEWLAVRGQRPWALFTLALPVVALEVMLGNRSAFVLYLLWGFLIAGDGRLGETLRKHFRQALIIGVVVFPVLFVIAHYDIGGPATTLGHAWDFWSVIWRLLKAMAGRAWTIVAFALASSWTRRVQRPRPSSSVPRIQSGTGGHVESHARRYVNEAVLPLYVLHQTPIVIIGFYVVQWNVGIPVRYLTISLVSHAVTLLVYDLCIRRYNITRVMLGMKWLKPEAVLLRGSFGE